MLQSFVMRELSEIKLLFKPNSSLDNNNCSLNFFKSDINEFTPKIFSGVFHQYKISLSYWSVGTRMIGSTHVLL
jgi:hypothetical protein